MGAPSVKLPLISWFFVITFNFGYALAKKKSSLVSGYQPDENFLSSTHPHKSNVYENIFCFKKTNTQTKKFPLANLFLQFYILFPSNNKKLRSLFFKKKKCC